jgi:hypothetical protein
MTLVSNTRTMICSEIRDWIMSSNMGVQAAPKISMTWWLLPLQRASITTSRGRGIGTLSFHLRLCEERHCQTSQIYDTPRRYIAKIMGDFFNKTNERQSHVNFHQTVNLKEMERNCRVNIKPCAKPLRRHRQSRPCLISQGKASELRERQLSSFTPDPTAHDCLNTAADKA